MELLSPEGLYVATLFSLTFAAVLCVAGCVEQWQERQRARFTAHRWNTDSQSDRKLTAALPR